MSTETGEIRTLLKNKWGVKGCVLGLDRGKRSTGPLYMVEGEASSSAGTAVSKNTKVLLRSRSKGR